MGPELDATMTGPGAGAAVDVVWTVLVWFIGAGVGFLVGTWWSDAFWREQVTWYKKSYYTLLMKTYGTAWTAGVKRDSKAKTDD